MEHYPAPQELIPKAELSRKQREEIYTTLSDGIITELVVQPFTIDPSENNPVQVALNQDFDSDHNNTLQLVSLDEGSSHSLLALFKPSSGESGDVRFACNIPSLMTRELIGNAIAERVLGYTVTPPIVARSLNGDPGTLQQFYSRDHYASAAMLRETMDFENFQLLYDAALDSDDAKRIALMDFILGSGSDRHLGNFLIKHSVDSSIPDIVAIDNAICLSTHACFLQNKQVMGPAFPYTAQNTPNGTIAAETPTAIPENLLKELSEALESWDSKLAADAALQELLEEDTRLFNKKREIGGIRFDVPIKTEIEFAKDRLRTLVEKKIFLSRANISSGTIISHRNETNPNPPHPDTPQLC